MSSAATPNEDWVRDVRAVFHNSQADFHQVKPWRYWRDMLFGGLIAYASAAIYVSAPAFSIVQLLAFLVAIFWLYRVGSLVHEVAHLGKHEMTSFKVTWNILIGIPTLTPSIFFYGAPSRPSQSASLWNPPRP